MSSSFAVISYYTLDTLYEKEAEGLIASCLHFGLEHSIVGVKNQGSWDKNCCHKPAFILKKLQELKKPVLWVDCDAIFLQKPIYLDGLDCDIAVRIDEDRAMDHRSRVLGGTIFVNHTKAALHLMRKWKEECKTQLKNGKEEVWDQACLRDVLYKEKDLKVQKLTVPYCRVFDWPRDVMPVEETVILHSQASRMYKKIINQEIASFPFLEQCDAEQLKTIRYRMRT